MKAVGARLPRYDGLGHVTGQTVFVDDVRVPDGNLWAKALRSPHHSASIRGFDTRKAAELPGVRGVIAHSDVPNNVYGHLEALGIPADEPLLAVDEVRYRGQPIAVVAADSEDAAQEAVDAIEVDFEERDALFDIRDAFDPDAPKIHPWGNWYPFFGGPTRARTAADPQGRRRRRLRAGRHDRPGRLSACCHRALPHRDAGMPCRAGGFGTPCRLLLHAGHVLLDGCRRGAPRAAAQQAQVHRRDRRRRLRRQGRHGHRDDLLAAGAQDRAGREMALDAGGGVPLLVHARAVAHRARGRGHEGRLDPRP